MAKKKAKRWTKARLAGLGIPAVLIPGILLAVALGWNPTKLSQVTNYRDIKTIFPDSGIVSNINDGDTFELQNGVAIRMISIDAPDRGNKNYTVAKDYLATLINGNRVYLEYDRIQDDKYGRVLAWIWINCEEKPVFLPYDYMRLSKNESREGLLGNPEGCKKGTLVNEAMVKKGLAKVDQLNDWGELKYEERIRSITASRSGL